MMQCAFKLIPQSHNAREHQTPPPSPASYNTPMSNADPAQRAKQLRDEINRHNRLYYVEANPEISDQQFDQLLKELIELEKQHPELQTSNSPTQRVGGEPIDNFKTVQHTVPMLSIDNTYNTDELQTWFDRCLKNLNLVNVQTTPHEEQNLFGQQDEPPIRFVLEPKIDGVAISLRYENGSLVQALTRGDGKRGDDITHNAKRIAPIPLQLHAPGEDGPKLPDVLEVRGEIYMPEDEFQRINDDRRNKDLEPFANPRNATAGSLKSLDPKVVADRKLRFFAHGRGEVDPMPFEHYSTLINAYRTWGLPTNEHTTTAVRFDEIWQFIETFEQRRPDLGYGTDGVVIKVDDFSQQEQLGYTSKAPRWCIAYKYAAEQARTQLQRVDWQVGKTGRITPRATMEPVFLAGSTVSHATLHNADEIERLDLHHGDTVIIEKAGEVIPQVVRVVQDERPKNANPVQPPEKCPSCGEQLVRLEDEVDIRCINPECPAQLREKLIWFVGRNQMDIDGLGEKVIDQLLDAKLVKSFGDLYALANHRDELLQLERMGEKKVDNLLQGIKDSKSRGLARVLAGLGIRHVGSRAAQVLASHFGNIDAMLQTNEETLSKINEIGPVTAQSIHQFLHSDSGEHVIRELRDANVDLTEQQIASQSESPFTGKTIVITGSLENHERKDLSDRLEKLGAKVTSSVSSKTDVVIVGGSPGSKLRKAQDLNIETWDEQQLNNALAETQS